jgi:NADH-quinone oxidoreductase subunit M
VLSLILFLPLLGCLVLAALPRLSDAAARWFWLAITLLDLALVVVLWIGYRDPGRYALSYEERVAWIPNVGSSYHLGVDGISLPLVALTSLTFVACAIFALKERTRPRSQAALFLFLQTASLGVFLSQDLILFFVFFDLSIVGMYFVIAGWGHGDAARSALKFFLYTFLGSLALLVGFIGLYLGSTPRTFDMVELSKAPPFGGNPLIGGLILAAVFIGLAIKTPTFPFHTWLPSAHTDAPAIGSVVLASILLKMGTYGFVRIAMPLLPDAWRQWAWLILVIGIISVLYGALVALAQTNLKRMIAYTSVNHMGYVIVAIGAAGVISTSAAQARDVAIAGAVVQMVSHGLITGALFLLAGVLWDRRENYGIASFGGLASTAPRFSALFVIAGFASLGLPGFSGFIAEFQVFAGSIGSVPWSAIALPGILITAAMFLLAMQKMLLGKTRGLSTGFRDLDATEVLAIAPLLILSVVIGVFPRVLLDVIEPAAAVVSTLVNR